ncbi:MAG: MOSC domain-containing protein [Ktedonobacteraceae bacterium]
MPIDIATLQSIQVGTPHQYGITNTADTLKRLYETSFVRIPSTQSRWLSITHLEGNEQADKKHHGTPNQAVLFYASEHYPIWQAELSQQEIGPGGFGENFTVAGLSEKTACIGDIYGIGETRVQVTGPRYPCTKIEKRWCMAGLTHRVAETGRTGWYCRVLQEGRVEPGMPILLVERPYPQWTVSLVNDFGHTRNADVELAYVLAACPLLPDFWQQLVVERAMVACEKQTVQASR